MDSYSVIELGHTAKQPLIWPPSELGDGLEPHGLIYTVRSPCGMYSTSGMQGGGVPGMGGWVGTGEGYTGYSTQPARLRLI